MCGGGRLGRKVGGILDGVTISDEACPGGLYLGRRELGRKKGGCLNKGYVEFLLGRGVRACIYIVGVLVVADA